MSLSSRKRLPAPLAPLDEEESAYVRGVEEARRRARVPFEDDFDRVAFAKRALSLIRPRDVRVVVFGSNYELRVETGRAWSRGDGQRWATIAIPPDASRQHIALAVAEIAGVARDPWVLDVLCRADSIA